MKQLITWFGAAALLVVIFGTIYTVAQQAQRLGANYPQVQLAEDAAASLNRGISPTELAPANVDMRHSLAPFIIVYDMSGRVISGAGSGYLDGKVPTIPYGVLTAAKGRDYHFVTWQPVPDVRVATVAVAAKNYYVVSGRSLKEVEKNESRTVELTAFGLLASLALLAVTREVRSRLPGRA